MEDYWKLMGVILGATGFWQVIGILFFYRNEKKLKAATARNLDAQTESHILKTWIDLTKKLEERVKELESEVNKLREVNAELLKQLGK